jgi:hypothetical protein
MTWGRYLYLNHNAIRTIDNLEFHPNLLHLAINNNQYVPHRRQLRHPPTLGAVSVRTGGNTHGDSTRAYARRIEELGEGLLGLGQLEYLDAVSAVKQRSQPRRLQ